MANKTIKLGPGLKRMDFTVTPSDLLSDLTDVSSVVLKVFTSDTVSVSWTATIVSQTALLLLLRYEPTDVELVALGRMGSFRVEAELTLTDTTLRCTDLDYFILKGEGSA